jgi:hypothetical protein
MNFLACTCEPGFTGNPESGCIRLECQTDSQCPSNKACINYKCEDPCLVTVRCGINEICSVFNHRPECSCEKGFIQDYEKGCILHEEVCRYDGDCPSQTACIRSECVNPCNATEPCGVNSICKVLDTLPVRTMICECLPGYQGNAAIQCDKRVLCPPDKIIDENGNCVCSPGTARNSYEECVFCDIYRGYKIENDHCVCALERGLIIDERGNCICPEEHGFKLTSRGECIRINVPECERNEDCPDYKYCALETKTCEDVCINHQCGVNAFCNATNHSKFKLNY